MILEGKNVSIGELSEAKLARKKFRAYLENLREENGIDVWLSPATTSTAPKGTATGSPIMNLPWTFAGLPAITIPAGKSKENLPIGLQLTGSFSKDELLLGFTIKINKTISSNL